MNLDELMDIELILEEANAYGVRYEVQDYAKKYLDEGYAPIEAYQKAYIELIK